MTAAATSVLVRAAGLPIQAWLAAAAPGLFAAVRELETTDADYRIAAAALAGQIGVELVPRTELTTANRRHVLAVRRCLHQGAPLTNDDWRWLEKTAAWLGLATLGAELASAERLAADLSSRQDNLAAAIEAENQRLLAAPWELLQSTPAGHRVLADPALASVADIAGRLAKGEPWTSKRMRRRSEHLWRVIARAAVKTTPRGWLGQVALAATGDDSDGLSLTPMAATEWTENVQARRQAAASTEPGDDTRLSVAPLQYAEPGDQLRIWAVAGDRLRTWQLRRTAALEAITSELRGGPLRLRDLEDRAFGPPDSKQRATMRTFTTRLTGMGVLQASVPPERIRQTWHVLGPAAPARPVASVSSAAGSGFLDVYRGTDGTAAVDLAGLEAAVEQLQRLRALMRADAPPAPGRLAGRIGPGPRPLLEVCTEELDTPSRRPAEPHSHGGWPAARTPGSGYTRLLAAIAAQADGSGPGGTADISASMLDAAGAPAGRLGWPADVTVRTFGGPGCVLNGTGPAGILDARFADMQEWLHGPVPHVTRYREYLADLDRRTGIRSIELLVPPLTERAANAVRRPRYTGAWTGDSDPDVYGPSWPGDAEFVPLSALTVQRDGDRILVAALGQPVRVLYHATRSPVGPWKNVADLLMRASPQWDLRTCPLRRSLEAYPDRAFLPRITIAGSVVLSAAQWRISPGELWDPAAPELARVRALARLRSRRGLPRWTFVSGQPGIKPFPCDLESLHALPLIERAADPPGPAGLILQEMLPPPPWLSTADRTAEPGDRSCAELMIRLLTDHPVNPAACQQRR